MITWGVIRFARLDLSSEIFSLVWLQPLLLTLQLMAVSVTVATVIGVIGAWAASSLANVAGRQPTLDGNPLQTTAGTQLLDRLAGWAVRVFFVAMVVALAMPLILHAAAWEASAGKFGWMIMTQTGSRADGTAGYGFFSGLVACGWIHGMVGAAMVSLFTWYGILQVPAAVRAQSRLELGPLAAWWRVQFPIAWPWTTIGMLGTAMLAATEMTVVDLYGFRTVADEFYLFYSADPSITSILMTCFVPLAILMTGLIWLTIMRTRFVATQRDARDPAPQIESMSRGWRAAAIAVALLIAFGVVAVPVGGLLVKLGHEVEVTNGAVTATWSALAAWDRLLTAPRIFASEYLWTTIIAVSAGILATTFAWPLAAIGRSHRTWERSLDLLTVVSVLIPGPIVGLLVVRVFQWPIPGFHGLYQQTIVPTLIAIMFRAVPVAYWVLRAGYRGMGTPVLEAAQMDDTWIRRMWQVDFRLMKGSLLLAALAAAVVVTGDVPVTLPVAPPGVTTVGTRLFGLLHSGARYQEAALAIWYLGAVVAIAMVMARRVFSLRGRLN